jgi:hypothetical protein
MGSALVVAAIGLAAAAFMLRFLLALLCEGAPSVCYWVIPLVAGDEEEIAQTNPETACALDTPNLALSPTGTTFGAGSSIYCRNSLGWCHVTIICAEGRTGYGSYQMRNHARDSHSGVPNLKCVP